MLVYLNVFFTFLHFSHDSFIILLRAQVSLTARIYVSVYSQNTPEADNIRTTLHMLFVFIINLGPVWVSLCLCMYVQLHVCLCVSEQEYDPAWACVYPSVFVCAYANLREC